MGDNNAEKLEKGIKRIFDPTAPSYNPATGEFDDVKTEEPAPEKPTHKTVVHDERTTTTEEY